MARQTVVHQRNKSRGRRWTLTTVIPSKNFLLEQVAKFYQGWDTDKVVMVPMEVGVTIVHPDDQFVKKVGVKIANRRTKEINFLLSYVWASDNELHLSLEGMFAHENIPPVDLRFTLTIRKDSDAVFLLRPNVNPKLRNGGPIIVHDFGPEPSDDEGEIIFNTLGLRKLDLS